MQPAGKHSPPKWADKFLEWYCSSEFIEEIQGDLHEAFHKQKDEKGLRYAQMVFIVNVFRSLSLKTIKSKSFSPGYHMQALKSNLVAIGRKFTRRWAFALINITGLSMSLAAAVLIFMHVRHELSFDSFNEKADRIFRMYCAYAEPGAEIRKFPYTPAVLSPTIAPAVPEIESSARVVNLYGNIIVSREGKTFKETNILRADSSLFSIFTFDFLKGNPVYALAEPNTIILTRSMAIKYFGSVEQALNQSLDIDSYGKTTYSVTGVIDDVPANAHFQFDALVSFDYKNERFNPDNWLAHDPATYVLIAQDASATQAEENIRTIVEKALNPVFLARYGKTYDEQKSHGGLQEYRLQPLKDVHLYSADMGEQGNIMYVYLFSTIGILLVCIATFNYVNLSTARVTWEARGASIRKVLGATRAHLRNLFLTESLLVAFIAAALAIAFAQGFLSLGIAVVRPFIPFEMLTFESILLMIALAIAVGIFAGLVPSALVATFDSAKVLKGQLAHGSQGSNLRQIFVTLQFTISIGLIICTFVITQQLDYMQKKSLGFNRENLLLINNVDKLGDKASTLKNAVAGKSFVVNASLAYNKVGEPHNYAAFTPVELIDQGRQDVTIGIPVYIGDEDYLQTLGVKLLMGHFFPKDLHRERQQIILNKQALREVGWQDREADDLIGKIIDVNGLRYELAGIVDDYHFQSLHQRIGAMAILSHYYQGYETLMLRIKPGAHQEAIREMQKLWAELAPETPFEYAFVDEELNHLYASENGVSILFSSFAALAILIACLGLLGLSIFSAERRIREIGLRKVLGASVGSIILLLSRNIMKLIGIAFFIASPMAWFLIQRWLQNFAYKIEVSSLTFIFAGLLTLLISLITIGVQCFKAAVVNPVDSLKYE